MNDLLQMVELNKYQSKLDDIWTMSFRVMDDIKESVRKEGTNLTKSLATKLTREYVPELIENFINLFSSLEPEVVNYLVLNASKYNVDHNEIDAKRMKSVGHSPLMDAIEKLLNQLDDLLLPDFITRLERTIKKGVGLPTKVSANGNYEYGNPSSSYG